MEGYSLNEWVRLNKFHIRFKEVREARGVERETAAETVGKSVSTIRSWEYGMSAPSIDDLWKLSDLLDVSVDYLIGRAQFSDQASAFTAPLPLFQKGVSEEVSKASFIVPSEWSADWAVFLPDEWVPTVPDVRPGEYLLVKNTDEHPKGTLVITTTLQVGWIVEQNQIAFSDGTRETAEEILGNVVGAITRSPDTWKAPPDIAQSDTPTPPLDPERLLRNLAKAVDVPERALRKAVIALCEAAGTDIVSDGVLSPLDLPDFLGNDWVTQADAAKMLGVSNQTINQLIKRGIIIAHPIDRHIRLSELVTYLRLRGQEGKAALQAFQSQKEEERQGDTPTQASDDD